MLKGGAELDESDLSVPINNLKVHMYIHVNCEMNVQHVSPKSSRIQQLHAA